jgi:hypothetical protein
MPGNFYLLNAFCYVFSYAFLSSKLPLIFSNKNSDDCSVFLMKFMEIHDPRTQMQNSFSQADILNLRIKYANEIFFTKLNKIDKTIVSEFFGDVCTFASIVTSTVLIYLILIYICF